MPRIHSEEDWAIQLLTQASVLTQPGFFYDFESEAFLIVSLLTMPEVFREGIARLRRDPFAEHLGHGEQTHNQKCLRFEIVEEARLCQNARLSEQLNRPIFFAMDSRHPHREVPSAFHRQDAGGRPGQRLEIGRAS